MVNAIYCYLLLLETELREEHFFLTGKEWKFFNAKTGRTLERVLGKMIN